MPGPVRGRADPLTREDIARAALRAFARDGVNGITMRKLGGELKVHYSTLYRLVNGKRGLMCLALDEVLATVPRPAPGTPWRQCVVSVFTSPRGALAAHPGAAAPLLDHPMPGAHGLSLAERALALLGGGGLDARRAAWAYSTLTQFTAAVCQERAWRSVADRFGGGPRDPRARVLLASTPRVDAVGSRWYAKEDLDARFEYGLNRLLDGISAARTASPTGQGAPE